MKCFVIMPFGNPKIDPEHSRKLELIYSQWIKPTVEAIKDSHDKNIACHRADKEFRPEDIITHIIENLVTSDIVIADLSGKNPNVFYELGVRHAVNNNTILIAENLDDIPFDLRGLRTIVYSYEPEPMLKLKASVDQAIREILAEPEKMDNPVRRFLYNQEVDKLIKQPTPPGYDVFKSVLAEMSSLKKEVNSQVEEVRHVMRLITSAGKPPVAVGQAKINLEFFEGTWTTKNTRSVYCARIVKKELFMPYSYAGEKGLTAHFYNLKLIGEALFGRFKWFGHPSTSGYVFLKVASQNELVGGWWYAHDMPSDIRNDLSRINTSIDGMNEITLERESAQSFPYWAEKYFKARIYEK